MARYINNKDFLQALVKYQEKLKVHKEKNLNTLPPQIPRYIGECFVQIATRLSSKGNFCGYTYKEEMVGDAIEKMVKYMYNFDSTKSENAFAYFTQIAYNAFIQRITNEKKQQYIKAKLSQNTFVEAEGSSAYGIADDDTRSKTILDFETTLTAKKEAQKISKQ